MNMITKVAADGDARTVAAKIKSRPLWQRAAIVDTNVARVLFRAFIGTGDPKAHSVKRRLWDISNALVPTKHVFDFNQGLMDLGATICTPRKPKCLLCPVSSMCRTQRAPRT